VVTLGDVVREYAGFVAYFTVFGALGFHFIVLRRTHAALAGTGVGRAMPDEVAAQASATAATIGTVGSLLFLAELMVAIAGIAAKHHITLAAAVQSNGGRLMTPLALVVVMTMAFLIAARRVSAAWVVAALAAIVLAFGGIISGHWRSMVNPVHKVAASLWLGTLLVLVLAGLPAVLRATLPGEHRGALVAELIARFSPLALTAAAILGITGVTTAWLHLKFVAALWTTPYGVTLDIKLLLVLAVLALGGWNWRRMRPQLGTESAAHQLRRSSGMELGVAAVVLLVTAVLVSLPSPRRPGSRGPGGPGGPGGPPPAAAPPAGGAPRATPATPAP